MILGGGRPMSFAKIYFETTSDVKMDVKLNAVTSLDADKCLLACDKMTLHVKSIA